MIGCAHKQCSRERKVWLPTHFVNDTDVEKHTWCVHCGIVKNVSGDRPKKIGFWMNVLSRVSFELGLTQVQRRLIAKEISQCPYLDDTFGAFGSSQQELFLSILRKYCDISHLDMDRII